MKPPVVFLSIVCVALAAALFLRHKKAQSTLDVAIKQSEKSSNEVAQLSTKLALAQGIATQMQTNLQGLLDKRTGEVINASNIVVQVRAMLASSQEETAKARRELQIQAERIGTLEAQRADLARRVGSLSQLEKQLADLREDLRFALGDRDTLVKESQRLQLEKADLERKLIDLPFLRLQVERVEADIQIAKRLASAKSGSRRDLRRPVVMLPDGAVDFAPPITVETGN
jgi:chromosome segregation ATPase